MINHLFIAGNPLPFHVGSHFLQAANTLGIKAVIHDTRLAFHKNRYVQAAYWRLLGKKPAHIRQYGRSLIKQGIITIPDLLLSIGTAPLTADVLRQIRAMGGQRAIFLTDDPFSQAHQSAWFRQALLEYDYIFTPRLANLAQLREITKATVTYLPFAYNPTVHYLVPIPFGAQQMGSDILFIGGADKDRIPWMEMFIRKGISVELYGGYWERYSATRPYAHGHADLATMRHLVPASKINLGLVRQANRDGHAMRSFEVPAMGGVLLAEDTGEHRALFGDEGETVLYFSDYEEAVTKAEWLLAHPDERRRLATAVYQQITTSNHTYADRLQTIINTIENSK